MQIKALRPWGGTLPSPDMFDISHISIAALFLAGLQTSAHCTVMCGAFNLAARHGADEWLNLQAGRLLSYALLGGVAGGLGQWLLASLPVGLSAGGLRVVLGLAVLGLAIQQWQRPTHCPKRAASTRGSFWRGMGWGVLPCPALYLALFIAATAGGAPLGAALLLAFGLGTLPALGAQAWLLWRPLAFCLAHPARRVALIGGSGLLVVLSGGWAMGQGGFFCQP